MSTTPSTSVTPLRPPSVCYSIVPPSRVDRGRKVIGIRMFTRGVKLFNSPSSTPGDDNPAGASSHQWRLRPDDNRGHVHEHQIVSEQKTVPATAPTANAPTATAPTATAPTATAPTATAPTATAPTATAPTATKGRAKKDNCKPFHLSALVLERIDVGDSGATPITRIATSAPASPTNGGGSGSYFILVSRRHPRTGERQFVAHPVECIRNFRSETRRAGGCLDLEAAEMAMRAAMSDDAMDADDATAAVAPAAAAQSARLLCMMPKSMRCALLQEQDDALEHSRGA
jgi:hypothetical protein